MSERFQNPVTLVYLYNHPVGIVLWQYENAVVSKLVPEILAVGVSKHHFALEDVEPALLQLKACFMVSWIISCLMRWLHPICIPWDYAIVRELRLLAHCIEHLEYAVKLRHTRVLMLRIASLLVVLLIRLNDLTIHMRLPHFNDISLMIIAALQVCSLTHWTCARLTSSAGD